LRLAIVFLQILDDFFEAFVIALAFVSLQTQTWYVQESVHLPNVCFGTSLNFVALSSLIEKVKGIVMKW
jgi:hypothetical protein